MPTTGVTGQEYKTKMIHQVVNLGKENITSADVFSEGTFHSKLAKQGLKLKGVQQQAHPLDRRSGTGRGKEMRKAGAGRHNWGNYQTDVKFDEVEYFSDNDNFDFIEMDHQNSVKDAELMKVKKNKKSVEIPCPMSLKINYKEQSVEFNLMEFPKLC